MSSTYVLPSTKLLSFEETNVFSLFMLGFFFCFLKNIPKGFLPYILSAERYGSHANQTGCHSASHFVQFHVLFPRKENYFDRLKPFPYWDGRRSLSLGARPLSLDASQIGRPSFPRVALGEAISYLCQPYRVSFAERGGFWLGWKMEGAGR